VKYWSVRANLPSCHHLRGYLHHLEYHWETPHLVSPLYPPPPPHSLPTTTANGTTVPAAGTALRRFARHTCPRAREAPAPATRTTTSGGTGMITGPAAGTARGAPAAGGTTRAPTATSMAAGTIAGYGAFLEGIGGYLEYGADLIWIGLCAPAL
jgi:hypothetical protein